MEEAEEAQEVVEATNKSASAQHIECVSAISYPLSFSVPSTALLAMLPLTVSVPASPIITTVGDPVMPLALVTAVLGTDTVIVSAATTLYPLAASTVIVTTVSDVLTTSLAASPAFTTASQPASSDCGCGGSTI